MINERITELRKHEGLTLAEFGSRIEYAKSSLSMIEKGNRVVTDNLIECIVKEFCVNENWLRLGEGAMFDEGEKKRRDLYNEIKRVLQKTLDTCLNFEFMLYFNGSKGDTIDEFDFYTFFYDLTEEKVRQSTVKPLELVNAFLNFYVQMHKCLSVSIKLFKVLEEFEYGDDLQVAQLKRKFSVSENKLSENVKYFKDYVNKYDTSSKVIGVLDNIMSLLIPLDYKEQIDVKRWLQERLSR